MRGAAFLLCAALGCGDGLAPGAGGYGPGEFVTEYGQAICERNFSCCSAEALAGHTQSSCNSMYSGGTPSFEERMMSSIAKGRRLFHADLAKACVLAVQQTTCGLWPPKQADMQACVDTAIEPRVSLGGTCQGGECVDSYCAGYTTTDSGRVIDGVCTATGGLGQPCEFVTDCISFVACDSETSTCVEKKPGGQACASVLECESNVCDRPSTGTAGQCAPARCFFELYAW